MIKFFRKIRQNLLSENKFSKYLLYAFGEIILVVIGILIALQVNSWNSNRIENITITNYYDRIITELDEGIVQAKSQKKGIDTLILMNRKALKILNSKNLDSLDNLKNFIGATATNWTIDYSFPITNEFLNGDYLSQIKNDNLERNFKYFSGLLEFIENNNKYNTNQYQNTIEPFFNKNINYSQVALKDYKMNLIQGGPPTDFKLLFDNLEIWNLVTFKLETLATESEISNIAIKGFESLKSEIINELNKK